MSILIGLLPFILMHALRAVMSARAALVLSAGLAGVTLLRQYATTGTKSLSLVAFILLGLVGLVSFLRADFAERGAGLAVNGGLTLFVLAGLALGQPFTVEWARDTVPSIHWGNPLFLHINMMISLAWGLGFVMLTVLSVPWRRQLPRWQRSVASILIMLSAAGFTMWYPSHAQQTAAPRAATAAPAR